MSRRFKFRLARALRVREVAESLAKAELAAAEADAIQAEERADGAAEQIHTARRQIAKRAATGAEVHPGEVLASHAAVDALLTAREIARQRADALRQVAEESKAKWSERRKDTRALERLEERQLERFRKELEAAEAAELDEWASSRGARKRAE